MKRKFALLWSLIAIVSYSEGQTGTSWSNYGNATRAFKPVEEIVIPCNYVGRLTDTLIPTPDTTLRKLLIAGEERNNLKKQVRNLEEQVKLLNDVIQEHVGKDELQEQYYRNQMENLQQQLAATKEIADSFEREVKRERRKRRLITGAGILTTGAAILLSLKK